MNQITNEESPMEQDASGQDRRSVTRFLAYKAESREEQFRVLQYPMSVEFEQRECPTTLEAGFYVIGVELPRAEPLTVTQDTTIETVNWHERRG